MSHPDLEIINNRVIIKSYNGSMTSYIIAYFSYYFLISLCAYKETNVYIKLIIHLIAILQLVMLHELLLLNNNVLAIIVITIIIIEVTRAISNFIDPRYR